MTSALPGAPGMADSILVTYREVHGSDGLFILSAAREAVDLGRAQGQRCADRSHSPLGSSPPPPWLMVCVCLFGALSSLELKQAGVRLAAAVLIDATVIRGLLLPASVQLVGMELVRPAPASVAAPRTRHGGTGTAVDATTTTYRRRERMRGSSSDLTAPGGAPSSIKDAAMGLGALNWTSFFEEEPDKSGKLVVFAYAFEHLIVDRASSASFHS